MTRLNPTEKTALAALSALYVALWSWASTLTGFWVDEGNTVLMIHMTWRRMFGNLLNDPHPFLYYIVLRFWDLAASWMGLELSVRSLSVLFGAASLWVYASVFKGLGAAPLARAAALFFMAFCPPFGYFATEARMYNMEIFFFGLSWLFLLRLLEEPQKRLWSWGLTLSAAALLHTHPWAPFEVVSLGLFAWWDPAKKGPEALRGAIACLAVSCVLFLPQSLFLLRMLHAETVVPHPAIFPGIWDFFSSHFGYYAGFSLPSSMGWLRWSAAFLALGLFWPWNRSRSQRAALSVWGALFFAGWFSIAMMARQMFPRYFLPCIPFIYLACFEVYLKPLEARAWIAWALAPLLLLGWWPMFEAMNYGAAREDTRNASAYISTHRQTGDGLAVAGISKIYLNQAGLEALEDPSLFRGRFWSLHARRIGCAAPCFCPEDHPGSFEVKEFKRFSSRFDGEYDLDLYLLQTKGSDHSLRDAKKVPSPPRS